jgi:aminomethyltransferase
MGRRTPLYDRHVALGARMVDFAGWDMPLQYTSMREEHLAVRSAAGLFDVSHMGEVSIRGAGAPAFVQRLISNDVSGMEPHHGRYALMLNDHGGIIDDVIAFSGEPGDPWLVVVNASTREKDVAWMHERAQDGVDVVDVSDRTALLAVQGPRAVDILEPLLTLAGGLPLRDVAGFGGGPARLEGVDTEFLFVSRTGYTGEDGFEVYAPWSDSPRVWDAIIEAGTPHGLRPAGLGARDTLRLEAGLRLYGQDMDETTDPYSAGLGWTVKREKGDFIGRAALEAIDPKRPPHRFLGLVPEGRAIARHGHEVLVDGRPGGVVTSGTFGFSVGHGVATARVSAELDENSTIAVRIREDVVPARRVPLPFYRRPR